MTGEVHVSTGSGAPSIAPTHDSEHYIDTTNDLVYVAEGTSSSADFKLLSDSNEAGPQYPLSLIFRSGDVVYGFKNLIDWYTIFNDGTSLTAIEQVIRGNEHIIIRYMADNHASGEPPIGEIQFDPTYSDNPPTEVKQ